MGDPFFSSLPASVRSFPPFEQRLDQCSRFEKSPVDKRDGRDSGLKKMAARSFRPGDFNRSNKGTQRRWEMARNGGDVGSKKNLSRRGWGRTQ